jgi:hypothetical protein
MGCTVSKSSSGGGSDGSASFSLSLPLSASSVLNHKELKLVHSLVSK